MCKMLEDVVGVTIASSTHVVRWVNRTEEDLDWYRVNRWAFQLVLA